MPEISQVYQDPKTAWSIRILLLSSAGILAIPSSLLFFYGAPALTRFLGNGDLIAALGVALAFIIMTLALAMLLLFGAGVQRMSVGPSGFQPQFRTWRHLSMPYAVPWAEVVWIELAEADAVLPERSVVLYHSSGRPCTIPLRTFPDEARLLGLLQQVTKERSMAPGWRRPSGRVRVW